jgi:hypothetical protein
VEALPTRHRPVLLLRRQLNSSPMGDSFLATVPRIRVRLTGQYFFVHLRRQRVPSSPPPVRQVFRRPTACRHHHFTSRNVVTSTSTVRGSLLSQ